MEQQSLDIILPCFNPIVGWNNNIIESFNTIKQQLPDVDIKLILINDGASKGINDLLINEIAKSITAFQYINYTENRGKGFALRQGVAASAANYCIYTDVDFPYTNESFLKVWDLLSTNKTDIAVGIKDENYYKHVPPFRKFISKLLRACTGFVLRLKVTDTQCGLKGFNQSGKSVFLTTTIDRYLFDLEFLFLASRQKNIRVQPIPIELKENIQFSSMRARILFAESINFLKIFFRSF